MTRDVREYLNDLLRQGKLKPHPQTEYSKPINFYLDYQSEHGPFLEPLFESITAEIEKQESRNRRAVDVRQRFSHCVRALILNVMDIRGLMKENLFLSISRDRNTYNLKNRYAPKTVTFNPFIDAFEGLVKTGYLKIHREGYYDPEGFNDTRQTQICATEKLTGTFQDFVSGREFSFVRRPVTRGDLDETIILRGLDKRKQEYHDNDFTDLARSNLNRINAVLSAHEYKLNLSEGEKAQLQKDLINNNFEDNEAQPFIDFTSVRLYRIFSEGSFDKGGRFYRGWWQNVPKKYRPFITIDGQKTVEFDYSALHPSILYAKAGITLNFDPYKIHSKVKRKLGKIAFNALLSAKAMPTKIPDKFDADHSGMSWRDFLNLMLEKHRVLNDADFFMNGYGLHVQFLDAELAEAILLHFAEQEIPCLSIHDSFIIVQDKAEELQTIMKKAYLDKFGQSIQIEQEY